MELSVRVVTRPLPGTMTRVLVIVVIVVTVLVILRAGYGPVTAIQLAFGAGLAGAQVARALLADAAPAQLPAGGPARERAEGPR
jgi:hypothetical protein